MNAQEIDLYVALPQGLYRYDAPAHALDLLQALDVRGLTGVQDFVEVAPVELMMVATPARMPLVPAASRVTYAAACAGAIAQNVYLACASLGLACVVRGWFDERRLARTLKLARGQRVLLAQTVGQPAAR
jgi:nitroreductase